MRKEHFEVLLEEINSKIECIAENVSGLHNLYERIDNMEYRLNIRIDTLEGAMQFLSDRLTKKINEALDRIENHEIRICHIEGMKN